MTIEAGLCVAVVNVNMMGCGLSSLGPGGRGHYPGQFSRCYAESHYQIGVVSNAPIMFCPLVGIGLMRYSHLKCQHRNGLID